MSSFPFFNQLDAKDCGPACLQMISKYYGKNYSLQTLRDKSYIAREGVSLQGLSAAAESIGMRSLGVSLNFHQLKTEAPLPLIAHWHQNHFIVVYKISKNRIYLADPAAGLLKYSHEEFKKGWLSASQSNSSKGLALLLEPMPEFYSSEDEEIKRNSFKFLFSYLRNYRKYVLQLIAGLLVSALILLIFPFLTQAIVDFGINNQDRNFITIVLLAQLVLIISRQSVDFIRGWILLHLSTRINIYLISDFLIKLMKLPLSFFDTRLVGDLLQRINDHKRVESFLTTSSLDFVFSLFSVLIFGIVLAVYSLKIFLLFLVGSILYYLWIRLFMNKRRELDHKKFSRLSVNQSKLIQIINGIEEIKINNAERHFRWEWEDLQATIFRVNVKSLSLNQYQQAGAVFINEIKNILITFLAAMAVVEGSMTLGMMLAVSYILGQLNTPLNRLISFLRTAQDARISLERLAEIQTIKDENANREKGITKNENHTLELNNVAFRYGDPSSPLVLENLNLVIPSNKITAIVGLSGSGKSTLIKLLLGYYRNYSGSIRAGDENLSNLNMTSWRQNCGVVLQNGYIFTDTITGNIALGEEKINRERLLEAARIANINSFIESLPSGYNTIIGQEGHTLSGGEKQRILIARAIYKNPSYFFLDEATSSLDANNEKTIMEHLAGFYEGRTVVIVAHRLSTVMNADQIVVLEKGRIVEKGSHNELWNRKNAYYNLVRDQLETGK